MLRLNRARHLAAPALVVSAIAGILGCGGGGTPLAEFFGSAFQTNNTNTNGGGGPVGGSSGSGGGLGGNDRTNVDPCTESQARKFVRVSLRNLDPDDFIHYFLVFIAFENGTKYPDGAACTDDVALYTKFGYEEIAENDQRSFGNICVEGPALIYFHRNGEFRSASGQLASGIGPSLGSGATFDAFFNSSGVLVPVPNRILFHNPGTGAGFNLNVSPKPTDACSVIVGGITNCAQDAWYYVSDVDEPVGSTVLGQGSFRRVPNEIQGTGCSCGLSGDPFSLLAPSNTSAANVRCNEFVRGGTVNFAFIRDDRTPPIPQLVWRVTDASGGVAQDFDKNSGVKGP